MDYVIFGIGMGASLVLLGLGTRMIGPALRYRRSRETGGVLRAEELVAQVSWARFCSSLGAAIALGGLLLLLVTAISMLLRVSDRAATISVIVALLAVIALMGLWSWAFVDRFGLYGIVAERRRVPVSVAPEDEEPATAPESVTPEPTPQPIAGPPVPQMTGPQPAAAMIDEVPATAPAPEHEAVGGQVQEHHRRRFTLRRHAPPPSEPPVVADREAEDTSAVPSPAPQAGDVAPQARDPRTAPHANDPNVVNPSDAAALDRILSEPDTRPTPAEPPAPEPDGGQPAPPGDTDDRDPTAS